MARVKYGALITDLAGSIGGITFQKNSSGSIAKLRNKTPLNPSLSQSDQQVALSKLVALWSTLSQAYQDNWAALAAAHTHFNAWGKETTLNGFQWFMSCNLNLISAGWDPISDAPSYSPISPPNDFTLSADADDFDINIASGWNPGDDKILIYATPPVRQTSVKLRRSLFLLDSYTGGNITNRDIRVKYENMFYLTWASFYAAAECNIFIRAKQVQFGTGMASYFNSAILKII